MHRWIAQAMGLEDGHDDRWFGAVGHHASLFLESTGCRVTIEEIDAIAETHFQSWVEPQSDHLTQFADDVAVLALERLFAERYGEDGEAKPDADAP